MSATWPLAGKGWLVQLRTDAELGTDRLTPAAQSDFAFVHIPYETPGFIGGMVEGYSGDIMDGAKVLLAAGVAMVAAR